MSEIHTCLMRAADPKAICSKKAPRKEGFSRRLLKALLKWSTPNAKEVPDSPSAVVVMTGGNLGGTVLTLPLVQAIRERFPNTHLITVSNTKVGQAFMQSQEIVDSSFYIMPTCFKSFGHFKYCLSELRKIKRFKPEITVFNHNGGIEKPLLLLRSKVRVGHVGIGLLNTPIDVGELYNFSVPLVEDTNWADSYCMLAEKMGAKAGRFAVATVPEDVKKQIQAQFDELKLSPGERAISLQLDVWEHQPWKQWPIEKLGRCAARLWKEHGVRPICMGTARAKEALETLKGLHPDLPFVDFLGKFSIVEAAAALQCCDINLCNDSGLLHLGASVGTPTVGVYGMTDPKKTWCYPSPHRYVRRSDCVPCFGKSSEVLAHCEHKMCLRELDESMVFNAVLEVLNHKQEKSVDTKPLAAAE